MVNIAGYNVNFGNMSGWLSTFWTFMLFLIGSIIIVSVVLWFIFSWNKKRTYVYPVTLIRVSEKGDILKELNNLKGGLSKNYLGMRDFKIIIPGQFKKFSLGRVPDFSLAETDGRLTFTTQGDSTLWQQCTRKMITEIIEESNLSEEELENYKHMLWEEINKEMKDNSYDEKAQVYRENVIDYMEKNKGKKEVKKLLVIPVPTEIKTKTVNDLTKTRLILDKTKVTAVGIAIGAFLIMVIAHLISLYIQTKVKCPIPTPVG